MLNRFAENINKPAESNEEKRVIDLATPGVIKALGVRLKEDIDQYCIDTYNDGNRWHLGASLIDNECSRYLWYTFRWAGQEKRESKEAEARMYRLFNRGHREEERYVEFLKGVGCQVWQYEDEATKKQFRMVGVNGHFGGSLDGIVKLPPRYGIDEALLAEFKTNNTGRGWAELNEKGLAVAKGQHYGQQSMYGTAYNLRYSAYLNINKNDDDLYIEIVKLDHNLGKQLIVKAEKIITSQEPLPRLSDNPTFWKCRYCPFKEICHSTKLPDRNCRSCHFAQPAANAEWFCNSFNGIIPRDFVPQACGNYKAIVNHAI